MKTNSKRYIILLLCCFFIHLAQAQSSYYGVIKVKASYLNSFIRLIEQSRNHNIIDIQQRYPAKELHRYASAPKNPPGVLQQFFTVRCPSQQQLQATLDSLRSLPSVIYAEPLYMFEPMYVPNDPGTQASNAPNYQYYLNNIRAFDAWDTERGNTSVTIAIIDFSFRLSHEDLGANLHPDPCDIGNPQNQCDSDLTGPFLYHGTAVAGISSATPDNNKGIAGVGFHCQYLPIKAISDDASFFNFDGALLYAAAKGASVINMSFGRPVSPTAPLSAFEQEILQLMVDTYDIVLVAAGGNSGQEDQWSPAVYPEVVAVAGSMPNDQKWAGSSYGYHMDISAPAVDTYTTYINSDNSYLGTGISGTSFAAPQVSAAAALLRAHFPALNARQIAARLKASSDPTDHLHPSFAEKLGKGRLNIQRALTPDPLFAMHVASVRTVQLQSQRYALIIRQQNLLDDANHVQLHVSCLSNYVSFLNHSVQLGLMPTLSVRQTTENDLVFEVSADTPPNHVAYFRLFYESEIGSFYEYIALRISPIDPVLYNQDLFVSYRPSGQISTYEYPYSEGLTFQEQTYARSAGFVLANSADDVWSTCPDYTGGYYEDFTSLAFYTSAKEMYSFLQPNYNPNQLTHRLYLDSMQNNILFHELRWRNSSITSQSIYTGWFFDFNLPDENGINLCQAEPESAIIYTQNNQGSIYTAIALLYASHAVDTTYYSIDLNGYDGSLQLDDGFTRAEMWHALTNYRQAAGGYHSPDVASMLSLKHTIAPGDSLIAAGAILIAPSLDSLKSLHRRAKELFLIRRSCLPPSVDSTYIVRSSDPIHAAFVRPDNGNVFNFYDEQSNLLLESESTLIYIIQQFPFEAKLFVQNVSFDFNHLFPSQLYPFHIIGVDDTPTAVQNGLTSLSIYPNPTRDALWIEQATDIPFRWTLYDIHGRQLMEGSSASIQTHIMLKNYKQGLYFLTITRQSGSPQTFRIILY